MESFWLCFEGLAFSFAVLLHCLAMDPQRPVYCSEYQKKREVKGRPCCPYAKHTCPHGMHSCEACGRPGHGRQECRYVRPTQEQAPADQEAPPASPPSAPPSSAASAPRPDLDVASASTGPVLVPGFGWQGEGKKEIMVLPSPRLHWWMLQIFPKPCVIPLVLCCKGKFPRPTRERFHRRLWRRQRRSRCGCKVASESSRT